MIPDEAVEAAARAAAKDEEASNWDDEPQYYRNGWLNRMQVALEAAAPYIRAQALEDAADRIIGPSEHLRDAATCRDIASELRRERAGCNLNI